MHVCRINILILGLKYRDFRRLIELHVTVGQIESEKIWFIVKH